MPEICDGDVNPDPGTFLASAHDLFAIDGLVRQRLYDNHRIEKPAGDLNFRIMSSRALRRLQREQEERAQLEAQTANEAQKPEEEEAEAEDEDDPGQKAPPNAFGLLGGQADDVEETSEDEIIQNDSTDVRQHQTNRTTTHASRPKKKKKKAKKKPSAVHTNDRSAEVSDHGTNATKDDEIDRALTELAAKKQPVEQGSDDEGLSTKEVQDRTFMLQAVKLLSIDQKNLNPVNEMRSLFGNIVLQDSSRDAITSQGADQAHRVDLRTALTGRYSRASKGKELGALAKRKNCLMEGQTNWPLASSGGLSMEFHHNIESYVKTFSIEHSRIYKDTQTQFRLCVESMQPENMISLLALNPYHISSLIQVSEIAKAQGDHSVSGDLLERALFTFGRSANSVFPSAMRDGLARFDFLQRANRELYLSMWRYIQNLMQRGTWKTAFEWAKLLYQLDPDTDPYGTTLLLDQLAIRGRQHQQLIDLFSESGFRSRWQHLPNMHISLVLALLKTKQPKLARRQLAYCIHAYPSIISSLASALEISPMPKALWAKLPSTDAEKLYTTLYASHAKDLWSQPAPQSLLVEVAETLDLYSEHLKSSPPPPVLEISLEDARHILLLEDRALIALLPRKFTQMPTSSFDVLPPPGVDTVGDFTQRAPAGAASRAIPNIGAIGGGALAALMNAAGVAGLGGPSQTTGADRGGQGQGQGPQGLLTRFLEWFNRPATAADAESDTAANSNATDPAHREEGQAALRDLARSIGMPADVSPDQLAAMLASMPGTFGIEDDFDASDYHEDPAHDHRDENGHYHDGDTGSETSDTMPPLVDGDDFGEHGLEGGAMALMRENAVRGPQQHHATVEDDVDEDLPAAATARSVPAPVTIQQPILTPSAPPLDEADPQRIQRWLLSAGLTDLQADRGTLGAYVARLKKLRENQRGWIVSMVRQRVGREVGDLVAGSL